MPPLSLQKCSTAQVKHSSALEENSLPVSSAEHNNQAATQLCNSSDRLNNERGDMGRYYLRDNSTLPRSFPAETSKTLQTLGNWSSR